VLIQVSQSIYDPTIPERRRRIALLKWLRLVSKQMEGYVNGLWRLGFGKDNPTSDELVARRLELERMGKDKTEIVRYYTRLIQEVPGMFLQTVLSQNSQNMFAEVFPAFKREMEACFDGARILERALDEGISLPVDDGSKTRVPFSLLFSSLEILEHLHILNLAAGDIIDLFPPDEANESHSPGE